MTALTALALGLLLAVVLPILSFLRSSRALQTVDRLERRLDRLEERARTVGVPADEPVPPPTVRSAPPRESPAAPRPATSEGAPSAPAPRVPPASPPIEAPGPVAQPAEALESQIGSRWMLYVGVATVVIGIGFFVQHAFENEWVTETMRVVIGAAAGGVLIFAGARFVSAGYALYGQVLSGGGFVALYLSTYAALNYYDLIGRAPAFALLVLITAIAAGLADRQSSRGLALTAVSGGFLTPFMVGSETDVQIPLFTFAAILVAGTMYLARRQGWPVLNLVSFLFTGITVASWANRFYTPATYFSTELFLTLFCAMFLYILRETRRSSDHLAGPVTRILWFAPVFYHAASLVILFTHNLAFLIYLIAVSLVGLLAASRAGARWPRLVLWAAVGLPFYGWLGQHAATSWFVGAAVTLFAIYGLHLAAQIEGMLREVRPLHPADVVLTLVNGLGLYAALYLLIEPRALALAGTAAGVAAAWNGVLFGVLRRRQRHAALHFLALAFTLVAIAVAVKLDGAWVTVGWAAEAAAIIGVGLRERRDWMRLGGVALLALAVARLLQLQLAPLPAAYAVLVNERVAVGAWIIAALYALAYVHSRANERWLPQDASGQSTGNGGQRRGREIAVAIVAANVLTLATLTTEINAFWEIRGPGLGSADALRDATNAELARQVTLSVSWAIYAAALTGAGFLRHYPPIRYLAIAVFGVTVLKVFTVDLSQLDQIYRALSTLALGVLLVGASYLYQRYRAQIA